MKRLIFIYLFLFFLVPLTQATHLIGGSMSYQYLGRNSRGNFNYKLTLNIYRDCQQSEVPFDPTIKIGIYHRNTNRTKFKTASIKLISKKLVSPPGSTNCQFKPTVCIEQGFYEGIIEVDPSTVGYELTFVRCCRNIQKNLKTGNDGTPDLGQTYYCKIPPTNINNSSPVFKGVPSPYMCANDTTSFLNTATDADGDSLVYYFVKPWAGGENTGAGSEPDPPPTLGKIKEVVYNAGYNEVIPFGATGYSFIDRFNGLTQYFTTQTGNYVVAIEVAEYRNGLLLSTVRLDLQIIFIDCPPNKKPSITSDKGRNFEIEAGSKLCFNVISNDPDNDNLSLTSIGDIFTGANGWKGPKATLSAKTGAGSITSEFCWQTSCEQSNANPYQFAVKVDDDGCPLKFNAVNFTIKVNPFLSNAIITGPSSLCQNAFGVYTASNLALNTTLEWEVTNGIITSGAGTANVTVKWTGTGQGKLRLREISQYGCPGEWKDYFITINVSPALPILSGPDTVCLNSTGLIYSIANFSSGLTATWILKTGTLLSYSNNLISAAWPKIGNQVIKVVVVNSSGCKSDTGYFKVNVRKPVPFIEGPASICPNAKKIEYNVTGSRGSQFVWTVTGGAIASASNTSQVFANWGNEGTGILTVTETDRFGCKSDAIVKLVNKTYLLESEMPKGKNSVCEFDMGVSYFVYAANGTTYAWNIKGGLLIPPADTNSIKVDWGQAGLGEVTITRTAYDSVNKKQCLSLPSTLNVIINPTPTASIIRGDFDICQLKDSLSYTLNGFAGSSYVWTINGNSQNISGQGTKTIKVAWKTPGSFVVSVRELSKDSCWGNVVDTMAIVHPKPTTGSITGPSVVCHPDYLAKNYNVTGFKNSVYTWFIQNGTIVSGQGTDSIVVDWAESELGSLKIQEISEFGCVGDTIYKDIIIDKLTVEMLMVSVGTPDDKIEVTWKNESRKDIPRVFELERRKTGELVWENIAQLNDLNTYIDQPLNTDNFPYDYRVKVKDLCSVDKISDVHTNVWLFGGKTEDPYAINMEFTDYLGWKNGVRKYELYRKVTGNGGYQPYDTFVEPAELFYNNGLDGYQQCYRILSYEKDGNLQESWSNEICFNFAPTIYIPNAFSPNGDGMNDKFIIKSGAIKTYELLIYNRWGEKLWETKDVNEFWDGNYRDKMAQMDVYMYVIKLTDFRDAPYHMNGTVHVIR